MSKNQTTYNRCSPTAHYPKEKTHILTKELHHYQIEAMIYKF